MFTKKAAVAMDRGTRPSLTQPSPYKRYGELIRNHPELKKSEINNAAKEAKKLGISVSKYLNTILTIRRAEQYDERNISNEEERGS